MSRFEQTRLWQSTLATQLDPDPEASYRRKLRVSLEDMRERSKVLAAEIARDLPEFTVHDISHIDALWEMAQLVVGEGYQLTPSEAFVLGGAFLVHDLGMGLAAYPHGASAVRNHPLWRDTVAAAIRKELGKVPSDSEVEAAPVEIQREATATVLRQLHAERADKLALAHWEDERGRRYHLIEDPELRETYGRVIGLVAHSHWWSVDELEGRLPRELGAPGGFANTWTVNSLKLACILRSADVIHLDDRRAPAFLRALRRPTGVALQHWTFQDKLYQPRLEADRLVFSAKAGFSAEESASWWLCYDTLQMVDRELEQVDSLLADARIPRLAARGLAYIDKPARLAKLIPTDDWHPVDAQIRVGAVASLVAKLGGAELYGDNLEVPLRELIQNGADAVRARRTLESLPSNWGKVQVRLIEDGAELWVEVTDTGVGMSPSVLTGPFLDFGTSFWGSHMMHSEFPGLESAGFESTGKFGIGFFSVFMWGDYVQVITRRYERGRDETQVLEFQKGLSGRPMLRPARTDEYLREGGTKVRVRLEHGINARALLNPFSDVVPLTLEEVCAKLCSTSDVTIQVFEPADTWVTAVEANDWMVMDGGALLQRINKPVQIAQVQSVTRACAQFGKLLEPVYNEGGQMIGRATLMASRSGIGTGVGGLLTVGGFAATGMSGIAGVLLGTVKGAARDSGIPLLDGDCLRNFATSQISKLKKKAYKDPVSQHALAVTVRQLGGMPENLPVARGAEGWLTPASLITWAEAVEEIFLIDIYILRSAEKFGPNFRLAPEVLACESGYPGIIHSSIEDWPVEDRGDYEGGTLLSFVVDCIADAWKVPRKRLYDKAMQRDARKTIGIVGSERIMDRVYTLTRSVGRG